MPIHHGDGTSASAAAGAERGAEADLTPAAMDVTGRDGQLAEDGNLIPQDYGKTVGKDTMWRWCAGNAGTTAALREGIVGDGFGTWELQAHLMHRRFRRGRSTAEHETDSQHYSR
jgi:hypothetical protein